MNVKSKNHYLIFAFCIFFYSCSNNQLLIESAKQKIDDKIVTDNQKEEKKDTNKAIPDLAKGYYFSFGLQNSLPFKEQSSESGVLDFSFRWNKFLTDNISFFTNYNISGMIQSSQNGYSYLEGAFDTGLRLNLFDSISISLFLGYGIMEYDSKKPSEETKYVSAYGDRYGFGVGWYKRKDESKIYNNKIDEHQLGYYGLSIEMDKYFKLNSLSSHSSITPKWRGRIHFTIGFEF